MALALEEILVKWQSVSPDDSIGQMHFTELGISSHISIWRLNQQSYVGISMLGDRLTHTNTQSPNQCRVPLLLVHERN